VPTFHEFASAGFVQVEPELRESTVGAIRWRLSYVLLPFFQHHRLSDITIAEVDRYRAAKVHERDQLRAARARGEKIDRRPLSNSTINRTIEWITVRKSKTDAGRRKVKIRPVLRDVLHAHKPLDASPDAYVFGTAQGKRQNPSNVRSRVIAKAVERANERLEDGELPRLTPHGLRRTFASLLYGIGETSPVVMAELGHTDPGLALKILRARHEA
jgi:site-specific recombinase XerC